QRNLFRLLKLTHSLGERNDAKVTGVSGGTGPVFAEALSQSKVKSEGLTANNETRRGGRPRPPTNLAQSEQLKTLTNLAIVRRAPLARVAKRGQTEYLISNPPIRRRRGVVIFPGNARSPRSAGVRFA